MRIAIGNDHAAVEQKIESVRTLEAMGHEVINVGTDQTESCDYPDFAARVARAVARETADFGVLLCGTGIGMAIAANKIPGVRAAVVHSVETARLAREHNDANVVCLGARVLDGLVMKQCLETFLATRFAGGRHARRVAKIAALERNPSAFEG